jgi:glyoxylase-like metal-dependent hydrolase (beta-lactamase superfamily II)
VATRREPAPGVFRLVLPLPFEELRWVNAYLLVGDQPTLVDCGIHDPSPHGDHGWSALASALSACSVAVGDLARTFVTHPHADHYGMAARVVDASGGELCMHELASADLHAYRDPGGRVGRLRVTLIGHGFSPADLDDISSFEDWRPYLSGIVEPTRPLRDLDGLEVGERAWTVIHTPGHARSHACLWSERDGILVSGDHVLPSVTPHIDVEGDDDPLHDYLASLERIEKLGPELVLPGHGRPFEGGAERARATLRHHDRRLGAILQVVRRTPHTAADISEEIFGRELFSLERRLAVGEALAHLVYLERRGEVERVPVGDGTVAFKKVSRAG